MSEPWKDFSPSSAPAADDGPWTDFQNLASRSGAKRKSFTLGLMEETARPIERASQAADATLGSIPVVGGLFRSTDAQRAAQGQMHNYFAQREQTQTPSMAGKITGSILGTAPTLAVRNPFLSSGAQGALTSDSDTVEGTAADTGVAAVLGYLGGKAVSKVGDALSPVIDPAVQRLHDAGVRMTPGMVKGGRAMVREDKAMSRPIVGDAIAAGRQTAQVTFNKAAVDQALAPLGVKVPAPIKPGHDSIDFAKTQISQAYDTVIPNLKVQLDGPQFAQSVATVGRNLKPAQKKQLTQIVSNELGSGQLAGQELKSAQGNIRRLAGKFARSQDPNDQLLGEALRAADDELTSAMMAQNPKWAPDLAKVNEAYRGYRVVADAAGRADDGLFNTGQLKQSTRRGDFSKNKDATARGEAFFQEFSNDARNVIPSRMPDSGTAGRMAAPNIFANVRGAAESLGYRLDDMGTQFRFVPRPAPVRAVAKGVNRLRGPLSAAAVAARSDTRD